ncbi:MAG: hypothetical protein J0H98_08170 [Solirubrobacterales bacterium]|nr:hypothetical protein [Solirubrobacterales bacterium]
MPLLEQNIGGLWVAKQSAKGTAASTPIKRLNWTAGSLEANRADGSEPAMATERFGKQIDYVDSLSGAGDPQVPALPPDLAYLLYLFFGAETVTGAADPYVHQFTPQAAGGFWATFWKSVGGSVVKRQRFADCRISQLTIEGSTGSKVVKVTPTIVCLDPAEEINADPIVAFSPGNPFLYTEGEGTFTIDGQVFRGQSQFSVTWNENLTPIYGDSVTAYDVATGQPDITVGVTIYLDAAGLQRYNAQVYGTPTPTAGAKPSKFLPALGSYGFTLAQKDASGPLTPAREFGLSLPGVKWSPDLAVPANPQGGATEISLAGSVRKSGVSALSTVTVTNGDAAYA